MSGADIGAVTALHALRDIYLGKIVSDDDCVRRALTLALHAADAACFANLVDGSTLVVAGAGDFDMLVIGNKSDYLLGAGIDTGTAADALLTVDLCDTVNDAHCAKLASVGTVAEADAGETAIHVALAAEQHSCLAVFGSFVVKTLYSVSFSAGAWNKCNLSDRSTRRNAHDLCNLFGSGRACRNALVNGSFALCNRSGIAVTAGEAAAAAVCACEALADSSLLGVNFDSEDLGGYCKNSTENCAENAENDNSKNY